MKTGIFALALLLSNLANSQQYDAVQSRSGFAPEARRLKSFTSEEYLKKSRTQNFVGGALMSAGILTIVVTAADALGNKVSNDVQNLIGGMFGGTPTPPKKRSYALPLSLSAISIFGSIVILNEAKENRASAKFAAVYLKVESVAIMTEKAQTNEPMPSVAIKLNF
ncbi:hypothetical protein EXU57_02150 [Segetibacter sp. 3557_3]|uniref:hypothetical protein n=1 Tax=Segetibacter sp. 3557_3 TaxID=2547429 RepID=UPI001058C8A8|nr:hypothetical protein [Segetibacter sp. 3557_3]TDH28896.1 hypothetical protein EXU57_02150 [Segetibacter sp. 3557_3]